MNFDFKSVTDSFRRSTYATLTLIVLLSVGCAEKDAKIGVGNPGGSGGKTGQQKPGPIPASNDTLLMSANLDEVSRLARAIGLALQKPSANFLDGCTEYRVIPNTQGIFLTGSVNCTFDDAIVQGQTSFRRESLGRDVYSSNATRGQLRSERIFFVRNLTDLANFVQRGEARRIAQFTLPRLNDGRSGNEIPATLTYSSTAAPTEAGKDGERLDISSDSVFIPEGINSSVFWAKGSRIRLNHRPDQTTSQYRLKAIELEAQNDVTFTSGRCPHAIGQFKALIATNGASPTSTTVKTTVTGITIGTGQESAWSTRCLDY